MQFVLHLSSLLVEVVVGERDSFGEMISLHLSKLES